MTPNKSEINKVATHPLQSWEWGEFRKEWGNEVVRLPFGQLMLHKIPKTNYKVATFIKGPKPNQSQLDTLKKIAKENNYIFIKLEPNIRHNKNSEILLKKSNARQGKTLFTPTTFWIDLTRNEDDVMKSFESKTRYNIRLAQKNGVEVVEDNSGKAFEKYLKLTKETVERQKFYAHSEKYHRLMWEHLHTSMSVNPIARLLTAKYRGEIITTWIVFVWKDFLYYPYGASTFKHKNIMANNLMMWEAIRYGQKNNLKTFDLWGREPGKGFTKFKEGYKPEIVRFIGTWDLVTSKLYSTYKLIDQTRWFFLRNKAKISRPTF
ncbi:peptidoglycan bridge formation glycyltransferase FemA/FemB family protein [Candidatus Woesebacteria bacterium]|nr:MAG: peptidoglycan bridge formation glycyltransferase FemA/FemB family protein [Candidatus Woesebacteria bacterium]